MIVLFKGSDIGREFKFQCFTFNISVYCNYFIVGSRFTCTIKYHRKEEEQRKAEQMRKEEEQKRKEEEQRKADDQGKQRF